MTTSNICNLQNLTFNPTINPLISIANIVFNCNLSSDISNRFLNGSYSITLTKILDQLNEPRRISITGILFARGGDSSYSFSLTWNAPVSGNVATVSAQASKTDPDGNRTNQPVTIMPSGAMDRDILNITPISASLTWVPIPNLSYEFKFNSSSNWASGQILDMVDILLILGGGPIILLETNIVSNNDILIEPRSPTKKIITEYKPKTQKVSIPQIDILAYTSINQLNLGEVRFIIKDTISYKCIYIPSDKCLETCIERNTRESNIVETIFYEYPDFNSVVKGKGCTLQEKLLSLIRKFHIPLTLEQFTGKIVLYGLLKYVLARIFNGDFDVKYLLQSYNKTFFRQLKKNRRFCQFIEPFIELGLQDYDKYFKCEFTETSCKCSNNAIKPHYD
jgi:hypothetical protein